MIVPKTLFFTTSCLKSTKKNGRVLMNSSLILAFRKLNSLTFILYHCVLMVFRSPILDYYFRCDSKVHGVAYLCTYLIHNDIICGRTPSKASLSPLNLRTSLLISQVLVNPEPRMDVLL